MCITFMFTNPGGSSIKYKLVLINNRDEYYARKTQDATLFKDEESGRSVIHATDLGGVVKGE